MLAEGLKSVPYEDGGRQTIPSAAARISNVSCRSINGARIHELELEVFETCWTPIYTIEFEALEGTYLEPIACPNEWTVCHIIDGFKLPDRLVYSTKTAPIAAGDRLAGFRLCSYGTKTIVRWYPADGAGVLVGKVTREELSCPISTEPWVWGSIKALYR